MLTNIYKLTMLGFIRAPIIPYHGLYEGTADHNAYRSHVVNHDDWREGLYELVSVPETNHSCGSLLKLSSGETLGFLLSASEVALICKINCLK